MPTSTVSIPFSAEAEQSVLGSVLLSEEAWDEVSPTLSKDDFHDPQHRAIWAAMESAVREYGRADGTTTLEVLRRQNGQVKVRADYLISLPSGVASPRDADRHARLVRELSLRRRLMSASSKVAAAAATNEDYRDKVEAMVRELYRADAPGITTPKTAAELLASPPPDVDMLTDPPLFVRSGLTVLSAPTKCGKTLWWTYLAWALTEGKTLHTWLEVPAAVSVLLIELELTEATMAKRIDFIRGYCGWDDGLSRFNVLCTRALQVDTHKGSQRLAQIIQTTVPKPELVIIDSYNAAVGGDPDSTKEARAALYSLRSIQERFGCAFGITCEIRKAPPGQKPRYNIDDLKGSNVVAYDADAVMMLKPTDDTKRKSHLLFPALRHCDDLPDNLLLARRGLELSLELQTEESAERTLTDALREHQEAGGDMTWKACQQALRDMGIRFDNNLLRSVRAAVLSGTA